MNEMGNTMTSATARSNVVPMATSTTSTTSTTTKIRVVSYNILSSQLANPQSYPTYPPQYLNKQYRLEQVLHKLEQEMNYNNNSKSSSQSKQLMNTTTASSSNDTTSSSQEEDRSTIFCLQEVSYEWAGALHTFFANHQYHVITGLYGKSFNGYMGILTAYPIQPFHTVHVDICRLSDTYPHPWPKSSSNNNNNNKYRSSSSSLSLIDQATKYIKQTFQYLQILPKDIPEPECHWNSAQRRYNVLLSVILAERKNTDNASTATTSTTSSNTITTEPSSSPLSLSNQFVISNYHMPCVYYDEKVMVLHSDLCLSRVQQMAQYEGDIPTNINHNNNNNNDVAIESTSSPEPPPIEPIVSQQTEVNDEKGAGTTTIDTSPLPLPSSEPPKKKKLRIRRPYILAGDFNIKPNDTAYQLLTTGKIDTNDPAYPTPPKDYIMSPSTTTTNHNNNNDNDTTSTTTTTVWKPLQIEPVRSAYAVQASKVLCNPSLNHQNNTTNDDHDDDDNKPHPVIKEYHSSGTGEPDFTNYSQMGGPEKPPFIDTLDYIFVSPNHDDVDNDDETAVAAAVEDNRSKYDNRHCSHNITVQNVLSLSHRDDILDGPYPNAVEPSDHVMIAADLDITFSTITTSTAR